MAFETKVILALIAKIISNAETVEAVTEAASVEGLALPSYQEVLEKRNEMRREGDKDFIEKAAHHAKGRLSYFIG